MQPNDAVYRQLQPEDRITLATMRQRRLSAPGPWPGRSAAAPSDHRARAGAQLADGRAGLRLAHVRSWPAASLASWPPGPAGKLALRNGVGWGAVTHACWAGSGRRSR